MGLYDYVRCEMPLEQCPEWATEFQSKDTPAQYLDRYEIRADGTLWHELYDTEDRSEPNAAGLMAFRGSQTPVNKRWEHEDEFDGVIDFYTSNSCGCCGGLVQIDPGTGDKFVCVEYRCVFVDGRVVKGPVLLSRTETAEGVFADSVAYDAAVEKLQAEWRAEKVQS